MPPDDLGHRFRRAVDEYEPSVDLPRPELLRGRARAHRRRTATAAAALAAVGIGGAVLAAAVQGGLGRPAPAAAPRGTLAASPAATAPAAGAPAAPAPPPAPASSAPRATPAAPAPPPPAAPAAPAPVWQDEFSAARLDRARWRVGWSWGRTADHTGAYAGDGNVQVRGGRLHLVQRREAVGGRRYSAGLVETLAPLGSSGYVEVRARTVAGQGQRSGLALLPVAGDGEGTSFSAWALGVLGRDPRTVHMSAHGPDASGRPRASTTAWSAGRDTSAGFHTYGLEWSPRTVAWFVDGVERRRTARLTPGGPVRLSLGVDVGGDPWWGEPDAATPFPTEYVVDVVRVYATRPGGHAAKFSP